MNALDIILISLMLLSGLVVIVAVLLQRSKSKGLSGTLVGGTETFYGKEKGMQKDKLLSRITAIASIVFVVLVLLVYIIQPKYEYKPDNESPVGSAYSENINL